MFSNENKLHPKPPQPTMNSQKESHLQLKAIKQLLLTDIQQNPTVSVVDKII
jgi:hypothetical protein